MARKSITKSKSNNVLVKLFNRIWQALKALVGADVDVYTNPICVKELLLYYPCPRDFFT